MNKRLTDFRNGALFVLLYHVMLIVFISLHTLLNPYNLTFQFTCSGFKMNALPPLVLLTVFTPIIYLLIRKFNRKAMFPLMGIHLLLVSFTLFQYDLGRNIYAYYLLLAYPAILPLYLICFTKRSAMVSWGALSAHVILTVICYLVGLIFAYDWLSQMLTQTYGSNDGMILLWLEYIVRSILPLIPIIIHLIIALFRWGFSSPHPKQSTE